MNVNSAASRPYRQAKASRQDLQSYRLLVAGGLFFSHGPGGISTEGINVRSNPESR